MGGGEVGGWYCDEIEGGWRVLVLRMEGREEEEEWVTLTGSGAVALLSEDI
jgi:hypothetical protein